MGENRIRDLDPHRVRSVARCPSVTRNVILSSVTTALTTKPRLMLPCRQALHAMTVTYFCLQITAAILEVYYVAAV